MFNPKDERMKTIKGGLQTPPYIFNWLNSLYNFDIDICASDEHHLCKKYFTKENPAKHHHWGLIGSTGFCNPDYANISPFSHQAEREAKMFNFTTVLLIPDINGEDRFWDICKSATTIIHIIGRVNFIRPDNGEEYKGNSRGSAIFEFSRKYHDTPPHHLYVKRDWIEENFGETK